MSKRKVITGKSKLAEFAEKGSTLKEPLNILQKKNSTMKSFRLTSQDLERLDMILESLNRELPTKINNTALIRGLIYLGTTAKKETLLHAIKES